MLTGQSGSCWKIASSSQVAVLNSLAVPLIQRLFYTQASLPWTVGPPFCLAIYFCIYQKDEGAIITFTVYVLATHIKVGVHSKEKCIDGSTRNRRASKWKLHHPMSWKHISDYKTSQGSWRITNGVLNKINSPAFTCWDCGKFQFTSHFGLVCLLV